MLSNNFKLICESFDFFQEGWFSKPDGYWKHELEEFCRRFQLFIKDHMKERPEMRQQMTSFLKNLKLKISENLPDEEYKKIMKSSLISHLNPLLKNMYP